MTEEDALMASQQILGILADVDTDAILLNAIGVEEINYRLGHDEDRQKSNYFQKDSNGHVNNKKSKIVVKYNNFPEWTKVQVQAAVDVWAANFESKVPIYIDATW
jgi:hypothetical protein